MKLGYCRVCERLALLTDDGQCADGCGKTKKISKRAEAKEAKAMAAIQAYRDREDAAQQARNDEMLAWCAAMKGKP